MSHSESSTADRLAAHLRAGTLLDLIPGRYAGTLLDEAEMRAWDPGHDIDANVLRDLLRGRVVTDPDPRGIRLRGARILGPLDLDHLNTAVALTLENCLLEQGLSAVGAHLPELVLARCWLSHAIEFAFIGDGMSVDGSVALAGSMLSANTTNGAVRLLDARLGSQLNCSGATLRNPSGPALYADGLQTDGGVFFSEGFTADGVGKLGAIRLLNARIGGELNCSGATLLNASGPALRIEGVQTNGGVFLDEGFTADGAGELGAVRMLGARIGGQLNCSGATLRNHSGPALIADGLQADGVLLR